ncbi:hypothetical protein DVR11_26955 [Paracoccus versutus]|nr:hypothetical protein DVR11_26955 [Paracoccus versutus]
MPQGAGHRAQGTGHRAQGTGHRAQGTGHRAQGTGCDRQLLNARRPSPGRASIHSTAGQVLGRMVPRRR